MTLTFEQDDESDIELLYSDSDDENEKPVLNGGLLSAADVVVQVPLNYATESEVKDKDGDTIKVEQAVEVTESDDILGAPPPIPSKNHNSNKLPNDAYSWEIEDENHEEFIQKDDKNDAVGKREFAGPGLTIPSFADDVGVNEKLYEFEIQSLMVPYPLNGLLLDNSQCYRGIQGFKNSCYMDSIIFSLFAFSGQLDYLLSLDYCFEGSNLVGGDMERTRRISLVLKDIVISLREELYCPYNKMVKLRSLLSPFNDKISEAFLDVEEVFYILFRKVYNLGNFFNFESGLGDFLFQIILPTTPKLTELQIPTTQMLFELSMLNLATKFVNIPAHYLIVQIPGRNAGRLCQGTFIIPSLTLDISSFLNGVHKACVLCGSEADVECSECFDLISTNTGTGMKSTFYCNRCEVIVHQHPDRKNHRKRNTIKKTGSIIPLESAQLNLLAVICINNYHYTSFVKCKKDEMRWVFFDSVPNGCSKVEIIEDLSLQLLNLKPDDVLDKENWDGQPTYLKHILMNSYVMIYEPSI